MAGRPEWAGAGECGGVAQVLESRPHLFRLFAIDGIRANLRPPDPLHELRQGPRKIRRQIHDPHPSAAGVVEVDEVELILALDGGAS